MEKKHLKGGECNSNAIKSPAVRLNINRSRLQLR